VDQRSNVGFKYLGVNSVAKVSAAILAAFVFVQPAAADPVCGLLEAALEFFRLQHGEVPYVTMRDAAGHRLMVLTAVDCGRLTWIASHTGKIETTIISSGGGSKTLSAALDRLRVMASGVNTFDSGSVNILFE
jgi:hypothetical protein